MNKTERKFTQTKNILATSGAVLLSFLFPLSARAASFSEMYVFGDSLSDTGNLFELTNEQIPSSPPYFNGRFSNGPIWVEYLAEDLNVSVNPQTNFAYGGATTGETNVTVSQAPGLLDQIDSFTKPPASLDPNALYIVWAGPNDYLNAGVTDPSQSVANLSTAIASLANDGAKNFLVPNLPDLGSLPRTRNTQVSDSLNRLTQLHNAGLAGTLNSLENTLPRDVNLTSFDVNAIFDRVLNDPASLGFTNVTEPCLNSQTGVACDNPSEYAFWDDIHPTTASHENLGEFAFMTLEKEEPASVPEPFSGMAILGFGVFGAGAMRDRKRKQVRAIPQEVSVKE